MTDYGTMQSRIAGEIKRTGLASEIQDAIQTAIQAYEKRPLWFNQNAATTVTVANVKAYALPSDFKEMRKLVIVEDNLDQTIEEITWPAMLDYDSNDFTGRPDEFAVHYAEVAATALVIPEMVLHPIPDGVYTLKLHYWRNLGALSANGDYNHWTREGELLIRCRAKRELYLHKIHDPDMAQLMAIAERDAYGELRTANVSRMSTGRLRARG